MYHCHFHYRFHLRLMYFYLLDFLRMNNNLILLNLFLAFFSFFYYSYLNCLLIYVSLLGNHLKLIPQCHCLLHLLPTGIQEDPEVPEPLASGGQLCVLWLCRLADDSTAVGLYHRLLAHRLLAASSDGQRPHQGCLTYHHL